jgi:hypothetical protein
MVSEKKDSKLAVKGESQIYEFIYIVQNADFKCLEINICALIINFFLGCLAWGSPNFLICGRHCC